jgi:hypothetical protein
VKLSNFLAKLCLDLSAAGHEPPKGFLGFSFKFKWRLDARLERECCGLNP